MPLTPWRSVFDTRFPSLNEEMDRVFDDFFGDVRIGGIPETKWLPAVDILETENDITVKMDVPAINPDDISIIVSGDTVTIEGERKREENQTQAEYYYTERAFGSFVRTVRLPEDVLGDKASAMYKDGVLNVIMPKSRRQSAREIKITVEDSGPAKITTQTAKARRKK
ncbi:MAG: Hsp20/alpha crystallin family protein [Syntrophorhabdaceae bacterium]